MSNVRTTPAEQAPAPRRSSLRASSLDMVRTMIVIVAIVIGLVLIVPRPDKVVQPSVDVAAIASDSTAQLGYTPSVPDVPAGWTATSAQVLSGTSSVLTWRVTWTTTDSTAVSLVQGSKPDAAWESAEVVNGAQTGTVQLSGHTWVVRTRPDRKLTALVLRGPQISTIVIGTATQAQLAQVASSLPLPAGAS